MYYRSKAMMMMLETFQVPTYVTTCAVVTLLVVMLWVLCTKE
jgi:hypothetical protein